MATGTWSFLHESILYEYLWYKFSAQSLRLRQVISDGRYLTKQPWVKVAFLEEIKNTAFPDITAIALHDRKGVRPGEVKFVTSLFNYTASQYKTAFEDFKTQNGCIVVLRHDYIPDALTKSYSCFDVYEIDYDDFVQFTKENFHRFLNRQVRLSTHKKIWVFQQSKNFWYTCPEVPAAADSGRWCPSDNLTAFDLNIGDTLLFVRHKGRRLQEVSSHWRTEKNIIDSWSLTDIYIGRVTFPIQGRNEYCVRSGNALDTPLWYDESESASFDTRIRKRNKLWPMVFEFEKISELKCLDLNMRRLYREVPDFVLAAKDVYVNHVSREISLDAYNKLLELLALSENQRRSNIQDQ